jgi:hypothetical protein
MTLLTERASAQTRGIYGFQNIETRVAVRLAVEGAAARLARPDCQEIFADFEDQSGQRLSTKLMASGKRPLDAFGELRFLDTRGTPQCRKSGTLAAFTQTGSLSIRVCGDRFRHAFELNRTSTEIVLIHEFLHALGLGENPPTSQAITERVNVRCGD